MKRCMIFVPFLLFLIGCSGDSAAIQEGLELRKMLLDGNGCTFCADIVADCLDLQTSFTLSCEGDKAGNLSFSVISPSTISGIAGRIDSSKGSIKFDDVVLTFPLMADEEFSPISAPWIFLRSLLGGYIHSAVEEGDLLHLSIYDSYEEDALLVEIWLNEHHTPVKAEILLKGKRIIALKVEDFCIL